MLFPAVGFRNGGENSVTIQNCKWVSRPGEPAQAALERVLEVRRRLPLLLFIATLCRAQISGGITQLWCR